MNYRGLMIGLIVALVAGAFAVVTWPYRGFVPLILPPPQSVTSTLPVAGKNTTGLPLTLPAGFSINVFAKDLGAPRDLVAMYQGLLASIPSKGTVVLLEDKNHDGVAETIKTLISGLNQPHGMAVTDVNPEDGTAYLYVAEASQLDRYTYDTIKQNVSDNVVLTKLPTGGRHTTRSVVLDPNGEGILVSIGSSCDVCHEQDSRRAAIYRYDFANKTFESYATGLRNSVFMARKDDTSEIWATEMGRDYLGDDIPPDEINIIKQGKNYGWPNCYGHNIHDTQFDKNTYIRNPCMEPVGPPSHIDLQAHSAPLGLAFVPTNPDWWPASYRGNLFVAYHGSWNRSVPTGYKIHRFELDSDGNVLKDEDFLTGFITAKGEVLGRPADVEFGWDGALYISDDRTGVVYRIMPPKR